MGPEQSPGGAQGGEAPWSSEDLAGDCIENRPSCKPEALQCMQGASMPRDR